MHTPVSIRTASPQDAEAILAIYAPYVTDTAVTFACAVPSAAEIADRIRRTLRKYPFLAAEAGGELLGYTYAGPFKDRAAYDWAVETSIYVRQDAKRLGIGRALYGALERVLAAQGFLNLNACLAYPEEDDEYLTRDSAVFHETLGYHLVGKFHKCGYKFNRWYHMVWMEKHIGDHVENQPSVITFDEVSARIREIAGLSDTV
jgi:L-amino acid N-acyltransferase YncA